MKVKRSKNLDDRVIGKIVEILDGWSGPLSWVTLVATVEERIGLHYTRQTLDKHERIKLAFASRKKAIAQGRQHELKIIDDPTLQAALDRITRLEAENNRLKAENANLLEQFVRWAHNAYIKGIGSEELNRPLPAVNRGQTDRAFRRIK